MVPVFMVTCDCNCARNGDIVYWSWREKLVSRRGEVDIEDKDLNFIGYAPINNLTGKAWPNICKLIHIAEGEK